MSTPQRHVPVFSPPNDVELHALQLSATYLKRAGNEAATRLLVSNESVTSKLELIATLRDEMRESAALCECLVQMFDGWDPDCRLTHRR